MEHTRTNAAVDAEDGRIYVLLFFVTLFMRLLSSDGGAGFNKDCNCLQLEARREEQRRALFSYGGEFVKRKSIGFLKGHSSRSSIWF